METPVSGDARQKRSPKRKSPLPRVKVVAEEAQGQPRAMPRRGHQGSLPGASPPQDPLPGSRAIIREGWSIWPNPCSLRLLDPPHPGVGGAEEGLLLQGGQKPACLWPVAPGSFTFDPGERPRSPAASSPPASREDLEDKQPRVLSAGLPLQHAPPAPPRGHPQPSPLRPNPTCCSFADTA